ncbi:MAG: class I SAM-dependent methyltransferase [Dehalococcoidia bacterium]
MTSSSPEPIDHVDRWRRIVVARREQHDAACAAQGRTTDDYWARRAESYRRFAKDASAAGDPFLEYVLRRLRPEDTVLDVGAGTGRHTVALAPYARRVTAVDPSAAMLRFLREDAAEQGLTNVDVIEGAWPDIAANAPEADVVISAHVLYPIEDVAPFLRALDAHARRLCCLHLMVRQPWFDSIGLWAAVHEQPRLPQPTYIDAVNLLHQLGCYANVEVAWVETPRGYASLDVAVEGFAETVAAGDDAARRQRLREALTERLEPQPDGRLALPLDRHPLATVSWQGGALRDAGRDA